MKLLVVSILLVVCAQQCSSSVCRDEALDCAQYRAEGGCFSGCRKWRIENCRKTCNLCECLDKTPEFCAKYKKDGRCRVANLQKHMKRNCMKTCGLCSEEDGGADCTFGCINGECTSKDNCTCDAGFEGEDCSIAICSSGCLNGDCYAPETCTCEAGWTGKDCSQCEDAHDCTGWEDCAEFYDQQAEGTKKYLKKYCMKTCGLCPF